MKQELRKILLEHRRNMSQEEVSHSSNIIWKQLKDWIEEHTPDVIHTYLPIQNEVDTLPLVRYALEKGHKVVVPKTLKNRALKHCVLHSLSELETGKFGTLHPTTEEEYEGRYDLIVIPAVGYDHEGNRLGYGAGYYDTFLQDHPEAMKVGLAHSFQMVDHLSVEEHDIPVDHVFCS
ncbi:5-formyltetrahydrofolate cyclo-ligase [Algivirga pacifica]|uniref:5-formyltetrahydrofolate cyclo-ligase n=2 Tax=Algivirga pacifica TaxID=1162670 RepID=A0ABP9DLC7_9BACT